MIAYITPIKSDVLSYGHTPSEINGDLLKNSFYQPLQGKTKSTLYTLEKGVG